MNLVLDADNYDLFIFDCDGVILNTNQLKMQHITESLSKFIDDPDQVSNIVEYFVSNNGLPRDVKLKKFIKNKKILEQVLAFYNLLNESSVDQSHILNGFQHFLDQIKEKTKIVVSGADAKELLSIFKTLSIDKLFKNIYGAPLTKDEHFNALVLDRAIYFGDSKYDAEIASKYNVDFVFIYEFTQWQNWQDEIETYDNCLSSISNWKDVAFKKIGTEEHHIKEKK